MRHRPRAVLSVLVASAVLVSCASSGDDGPGDLSARHLPSPEARTYCGLVREFYERLDEWFTAAQEALGSDATDAALDQRYVGFIRENQPLFGELEVAAPDVIAGVAATQARAFAEVATQGSLAPLETEAARAAERRTVAYEEEECGIVVE